MYQNLPIELIEKDNWCVFRKEWSPLKSKYTKRPYDAKTGQWAKSNDPETWSDFDTAMSVIDLYDGLGFFFDGEYYGVDLDNIESEIIRYQQNDLENNVLAEFLDLLTSYAEISPSGKGVHIICKGQLPPGGRRKGDIEMYDQGRFFTMTGQQIGNYNHIFDDDMGKINYLHHKYIGEQDVPIHELSQIEEDGHHLSVEEIIEEAKNGKNQQRFTLLYEGGWEQVYSSQSEADMAFANDLAYWTARDYDKMDTIFRSSSLFREKWDEKHGDSTYGHQTLMKAIRDCLNTFKPFRLNISEEALKGTKKPRKQFSYDDMGNTERFLYTFKENVLYSYVNKCWYYWNNKYWTEDTLGKIQSMADYVANNIHKEPIYVSNPNDEKMMEEARKALTKHVKYTRQFKGKTNMIQDVQHHVSIEPQLFDKDGNLFNTHSGYIDLNTGILTPHEFGKNKYFTRISNTEYQPSALCPRWEQFLDEIFQSDKRLIDYLQRAVGYSLSNSTTEQVMFILLGNGKNGKSVLLNVLHEVFGTYAMNIQPQTIAVKNGGQTANQDIARLKGARFVTTTEPNQGMKFDEGTIKQITGGDTVTARFLYGKEFEFKPEFKLWMATNYKPIIAGTDDGIWRRMVLIPFNYTIPDEKVDKKLGMKLKEELPGILNWCLEGFIKWRQHGLDDEPEIVKEQRHEYRSEMDMVQRFIADCCSVGENRSVAAKELWLAFRHWVSENNEYDGYTQTKFGREFGKHFTKERKTDGNYYLGVGLIKNENFYNAFSGITEIG